MHHARSKRSEINSISTHTSLSELVEWWRYPWHCLQGSVEQTISDQFTEHIQHK